MRGIIHAASGEDLAADLHRHDGKTTVDRSIRGRLVYHHEGTVTQ
jgi:hypothetical protein